MTRPPGAQDASGGLVIGGSYIFAYCCPVADVGSRVVNPLEYLYYCAHIVSHCLYCRIKLGKGMSCFLVKKFVMDFG